MKKTRETTKFGQPLVSVIMPVFNGRHYIDQAINSILNQTFQDFEFLIVDDGSEDKSWKIIESYQTKYPDKIRCFKLPIHLGTFGATNFALKISQGYFIALMDADDIAHPERFEKQVNYLLNHPEVIVLGTQVNIINEKGEIIDQKRLPLDYEQIYKSFAIFHPMVHPSCMVRKYLPNGKTFRYINKFGVNDDYNTFFSILRIGKFANLDECLLSYRIHNNNHSIKDVRIRFLTIIKIRFEAYKKYKYVYSPLDLILILCQIIVVFSIPQKFIFKIYTFSRDLYYNLSLARIIENMTVNFKSIQFLRLSKNYLAGLKSILF